MPSHLNFASAEVLGLIQWRQSLLDSVSFVDRREVFVPWTATISVSQNLTNVSDSNYQITADNLSVNPQMQNVLTGSGIYNQEAGGNQFLGENQPLNLFENSQNNGIYFASTSIHSTWRVSRYGCSKCKLRIIL
jgi:hypothetical protein